MGRTEGCGESCTPFLQWRHQGGPGGHIYLRHTVYGLRLTGETPGAPILRSLKEEASAGGWNSSGAADGGRAEYG